METVKHTPIPTDWSRALNWIRQSNRSADQITLLRLVLREVRVVPDMSTLFACAEMNHIWVAQLAREVAPTGWATIGIWPITRAAYAIRYVELETGKDLDPARLPKWLGEWCV